MCFRENLCYLWQRQGMSYKYKVNLLGTFQQAGYLQTSKQVKIKPRRHPGLLPMEELISFWDRKRSKKEEGVSWPQKTLTCWGWAPVSRHQQTKAHHPSFCPPVIALPLPNLAEDTHGPCLLVSLLQSGVKRAGDLKGQQANLLSINLIGKSHLNPERPLILVLRSLSFIPRMKKH